MECMQCFWIDCCCCKDGKLLCGVVGKKIRNRKDEFLGHGCVLESKRMLKVPVNRFKWLKRLTMINKTLGCAIECIMGCTIWAFFYPMLMAGQGREG